MDIQIIDHRPNNSNTYSQLPRNPSFAQAQALFKMEVDRSLGWDITPQGGYCYTITGFELKEGPANLQPMVRDENGQPLDQRLVLLHWPDAPQLPGDFSGPNYFSNAVAGFTDGGGSVGFGFGAGGVVGGDGGPYAIWLAKDPEGQQVQFADCAKKLGWLGGTDHLVANPIFEVVLKGDAPPTPTPTPGVGRRIAIYDEAGNIWGVAPLKTGAVPAGKRTLRVLSDDEELGFVALDGG